MIRLLTEQEDQEFNRLLLFYWYEAHRCRDSKAYLAGSVMAGSVLETLLMIIINAYPDKLINATRLPPRKNSIKPLRAWTLEELIDIAKQLKLIRPNLISNIDKINIKKGTTGDFADYVRTARNLLHPTKHAKDHLGKRFTKRQLNMTFGTIMIIAKNFNKQHDQYHKLNLDSSKSI